MSHEETIMFLDEQVKHVVGKIELLDEADNLVWDTIDSMGKTITSMSERMDILSERIDILVERLEAK